MDASERSLLDISRLRWPVIEFSQSWVRPQVDASGFSRICSNGSRSFVKSEASFLGWRHGNVVSIMLIELWERLRGYDKWVQVEARIESTRVWKQETRYGTVDYSDDVMLWTDPTGMNHRAPFTTQEGSRSLS